MTLEIDGFAQIQLLTPNGEQINQITAGKMGLAIYFEITLTTNLKLYGVLSQGGESLPLLLTFGPVGGPGGGQRALGAAVDARRARGVGEDGRLHGGVTVPAAAARWTGARGPAGRQSVIEARRTGRWRRG